MAPRHQAPRGTRDLLPADTRLWRWAEARALQVLERYGFRELRSPMSEESELFARTAGESSDVVQKEMYRFQDLGARDLALRPEFTAGVMRAYLEHGLGGRARVHRLWSMGPVFRTAARRRGATGQFSQINAELVGSAAPGADVEVISLFVDLYEAWGFRDLTVLRRSCLRRTSLLATSRGRSSIAESPANAGPARRSALRFAPRRDTANI